VNPQHLIDTVRAQPIWAIAALAVVLALLCIALIARIERLKDRLHVAQAAAEDAAKAAAMAAPGGIDPDVVADILRKGERPTLDGVYATMQGRAR
jgi:putative intracellular protease/amidase